MSMYENVGLTSLDYIEEILHLRKALADISDECSKAYDKIANFEQQRWVSVKDRLPDKDGKYLVFGKVALSDIHEEPIRLARFTERKEWLTSLSVKYWMPLPTLPEPENEDDVE